MRKPTPTPTPTPAEAELDRLYQGPLQDFIAFRNALAASLKKAGDAHESKSVKALAKPSASAWAVNQVFWKERAIFDALIDASDRLRAALASGPSDAAERERHEAVNAAVRRARSVLEESGQNASDALMRRVATTFDALASYGSANPNPMNGRLTEDLEPAGFGAFTALVLVPALPEPAGQTQGAPEDEVAKQEAALEKAKSQLTEAANRMTRLETELNARKARLIAAQEAAEEAAVRVAETETRLLQARARADS